MRPKVKYWVYTGDPWVCRSSQIVDSHWRPVKYIICAVFGCLRRKIALWVTCAGSARWRHNALRREVNCLTLCADSNLSSHTAERQTMMDGKTETKRAGGGWGWEGGGVHPVEKLGVFGRREASKSSLFVLLTPSKQCYRRCQCGLFTILPTWIAPFVAVKFHWQASN